MRPGSGPLPVGAAQVVLASSSARSPWPATSLLGATGEGTGIRLAEEGRRIGQE